jgi:hypothetical protein
MSTPTEEGVESDSEIKERLRFEQRELEAAAADREQVDPQVLEDQPQPAPPQQKQTRFTVVCGCNVPLPGDNPPEGKTTRSIAAVFIVATSIPDAREQAVTLLAANVKETTVDDWEAVIVYLGHQEMLNG